MLYTVLDRVGVRFGNILWRNRVDPRYVEMNTWVPEMVPGAGGMEVHYRFSKDDPNPIVLTMKQAQDWREHVRAVLVGKLGCRVSEFSKQFWACADGVTLLRMEATMVNRVTWRVWAPREHMAAFRICRFLRDTTCNPVYAACRRRLELEAMDDR